MAIRTLAADELTTVSLTSIFTVGIGNTAAIANAVLCNASASAVDVDVYVSSPSDDVLVTTVRLPAGVGRSVIVKELIGGLNSQYSVKLQPSAATQVNIVLYGNTTKS